MFNGGGDAGETYVVISEGERVRWEKDVLGEENAGRHQGDDYT